MNRVRDYINHHYTIAEVYELCFGKHISHSQACYCPFHTNRNSKAAKIYTDTNLLHCFGECQRNYTAYDLLVQFRPDLLDRIKGQVLPVYMKPKQSLPELELDLSQENKLIYKQLKNYYYATGT